MAVEEVIIKYKADVTGLRPVQQEMGKVSDATKKVGQEIKAAFASNALDKANAGLETHEQKLKDVQAVYSNVNQELRDLTNQIASGKLEGEGLQKAVTRAAELKDNIADARSEINKLSSDTRVFDLVAEGARGITAAMALAQGATALFGEENKDLQKALLKTQGALALLQGAQELANIATTKGGIASKAYGVALQVVDKIQKAFAISSAAAWGVATAGITVAIAAVAALVIQYNKLEEAEEDLAAERERRASNDLQVAKNIATERDNELKQTLINAQTQRQALTAQLSFDQQAVKSAEAKFKGISAATEGVLKDLGAENEGYKKLRQEQLKAETEFLDAQTKLKTSRDKLFEFDEGNRRAAFNANLKAIEDEFARQAEVESRLQKERLQANIEAATDGSGIVPVISVPVKFEVTPRSIEEAIQDFAIKFTAVLPKIQQAMQGIEQIVSLSFQGQTEKIRTEKEAQLAILTAASQQELALAGNDAKQREIIQKEFEAKKAKLDRDAAIKTATLEREKAIYNKAFGIANAVINTAAGVANALKDGVAGIPQAIIIAGLGAIQIASIASQQIPEIPKFEKGGSVPLMGGEIRRDGAIVGHSHRQGGVLIEAEGGEFINSRKSAAKYYDTLKAANDMNLEGHIYSKYIEPTLRQVAAVAQAQNESYDDFKLRNEVKKSRQAQIQSAQYIVNGIVEGISENNYLNKRYFG